MAAMTWLAALDGRVLWRRLFDTSHPAVDSRVVLATKAVAVCWVLTGLVTRFSALPLVAISLGAAFLVLFSPFTRVAALLQACVIGIDLALEPNSFSYHRLFFALFSFSVAASGPGWASWLPRLQTALLYFGAAFDKLLNPDWRSGQFLQSFAQELATFGRLWAPGGHVGEPNGAAIVANQILTRASAQAVSWTVITCELVLSVGFAAGRRWAAMLAIVLHLSILTLTGGTFGVFFHLGLGTALLVLEVRPTLALGAAVALSLPWLSWPFALLTLVGVAAGQILYKR